jgi:hypothetical protein
MNGSSSGPDISMKSKPPYIGTVSTLLMKWFAEHFLKRKPSGKVLMFYAATRFFAAPIYCFTVLFKMTSFAYIAIVLMPYSLWASAF